MAHLWNRPRWAFGQLLLDHSHKVLGKSSAKNASLFPHFPQRSLPPISILFKTSSKTKRHNYRATFQIMRRTHASLSRQAGIDPKLVADQLGDGLGVNLDFYTVAALHKRQDAVELLESALARRCSA